MSETGVGFEPVPQLMERFRSAGCGVSPDGRVRFPVELIRKSIDSAAKSVRLWNRDASASFEIDCQHTWFIPGMTCIKVYDGETGEARDSNREDLATITRVSDALQNIDAVCITSKNVEESNIHGEIEYKKNKRYIHIKIKVPNIPSHRTFNRNSGQAGQLPVLVSEF
jgi:trimethylamine:corrinoid methyltransferase-like protein